MSRVLRAAVGELRAEYDWSDPVRAAVIVPDGSGRWASTFYSAHMERHGDDRLRVRLDRLGVGTCLRRREPVYIRRNRVDLGRNDVDKYEFTRRPVDAQFLYAIPIFADAADWLREDPSARSTPLAALVIDKMDSVDSLLLDEGEQDALVDVATIVGEEVKGRRFAGDPRLIGTGTVGLTGLEQTRCVRKLPRVAPQRA